jgi:hypothetical protein
MSYDPGDIARLFSDRSTGGGDLLCDTIDSSTVSSGQEDPRALTGERASHRATSGAHSVDDRVLVLEQHHCLRSPS